MLGKRQVFHTKKIFIEHLDTLEEESLHSASLVKRSVKFWSKNKAEEYKGKEKLHSDLVVDYFVYHHVEE